MQCEGVDQSGHHKPPTWHRWLSSASLLRHYLRGTGEHVYSGWMCLVIESPAAFDGLPWMQASWSGDAVRAVRDGFTLAPYSKSILAHSRLPEAQALHRGVLPWMVRTSTCKTQPLFDGTLILHIWVTRWRVIPPGPRHPAAGGRS